MSKFPLLCALVLLSAACAPPALAQAANAEPGYCAQFHPNDDCNSTGPETPKSRPASVESEPEQTAPVVAPAPAAKKKKRKATAAVAPAGGAVATPK